jgi:hypothetical protein
MPFHFNNSFHQTKTPITMANIDIMNAEGSNKCIRFTVYEGSGPQARRALLLKENQNLRLMSTYCILRCQNTEKHVFDSFNTKNV